MNTEADPINPPGGAHKLASVKKAYEEAKRRLQSSKDGLKRHQEVAEDEMKKCEELLRQLETEYNDTLEEMRRHKDEQVNESCLSLYILCWKHHVKCCSVDR